MSQSITLSSPSAQILPETTNQGRTAPGRFGKFLLEKGIRPLWWIAGIGIIVQFVIFKQLYPYPDFFSDSYSYLFAAYAHLDVNIWPIGYSKFLSLFHYLTYSSLALTAFQYIFLELSAGYFFFTFLYLFRPGKPSRMILFLFLFFNPLFLYISNYINSDPLFAALSILWFTQLLWIIYSPRLLPIFLQALLLFLCFTVRNNAYYYPLIGCLAILLSTFNWKLKLTGILLPLVSVVIFIIQTRQAAYELTGHREFSLFTGWQLANNALYMRGHIQVDSTKLPTERTKELDRIASNFFAATKPEFDGYLTAYVANYFIRQPEAPLKQFYARHYKPKDNYQDIIAWGQVSAVFEDYGAYLIKHYPIEFIRYFLFRNMTNYFLPPLEKLEIYNLGTDEVLPIAQYWFHFKNTFVSAVSKEGQGKLLFLYPLFFLFINLYFFVNLNWLFISKQIRWNSPFLSRTLLLSGTFLFINLFFSILATINVLRYQFFPMILCLSFSLIIMEWDGSKELKVSTIHPYARN